MCNLIITTLLLRCVSESDDVDEELMKLDSKPSESDYPRSALEHRCTDKPVGVMDRGRDGEGEEERKMVGCLNIAYKLDHHWLLGVYKVVIKLHCFAVQSKEAIGSSRSLRW